MDFDPLKNSNLNKPLERPFQELPKPNPYFTFKIGYLNSSYRPLKLAAKTANF